jgi:chromate transport protein ChrA
MRSLRSGLPAALAVIGFAFLLIRRDTTGFEMWSMLVGAAISVLLFNVLFRMGASGDRDREREAQAREYFAEHGRWPDE